MLARMWWRLRYVEHRSPRGADTILVAPTGTGHDEVPIQAALDRLAGYDTAEWVVYREALARWAASRWRWWRRRPVWVTGGTVQLTGGRYEVAASITPGVGQRLSGG